MGNSMKLGVRLGLGFAAVLALTVVMAVVSYLRLAGLNAEIENMVTDKFPKTVMANDAVDQINITARAIRNAMLVKSPEEAKKEIERLMEARKKTGEIFDKLEKLITSEAGLKVFAAAMESRRLAVADQNQVLELFKVGKKDEAIDVLVTKVRKSQGDYLKAVGDLITFQSELMDKSGKEADAMAEGGQRLILILGALAALFSVAIAWWIINSVLKQLGGEPDYARDMVTRLSQGDLTMKLVTHPKDNSSLLFAMKTMIGKLSQVVTDVNSGAQALASASEEVSATAQSLSRPPANRPPVWKKPVPALSR
jgi:methyl-accepting chemotaxis protein